MWGCLKPQPRMHWAHSPEAAEWNRALVLAVGRRKHTQPCLQWSWEFQALPRRGRRQVTGEQPVPTAARQRAKHVWARLAVPAPLLK